jgi:TonB family protein
MLNCRQGVQIQKVKAGQYFVGKVGFQGTVDFSEESATRFDVAVGKLNYIGHIALPSSFDKGENLGRVLISDPFVIDRREEADAWLVANQVSLDPQYEFVVAVARSAERSTEGGGTALTVILKLRVGADGSVREGHIAKPSGNDFVDDSALREAVRNWRLLPAIENGAPVERWGNYSVTYRPTN